MIHDINLLKNAKRYLEVVDKLILDLETTKSKLSEFTVYPTIHASYIQISKSIEELKKSKELAIRAVNTKGQVNGV